MGFLFGALAGVLDFALGALWLILLVNALLSWVRLDDRFSPIVHFLARVSDAVCNPIRRLFPTVVGGLDLAPLIAMLAIVFLQRFLVGFLRSMAVPM